MFEAKFNYLMLIMMAAAAVFGVPLAHAQLDEITVTATKRETTAQNTALALTVLDQRSLDALGIQDVSSLGAQVPSLVFGNKNNDWKVTLRGVGSDNIDINAEPAVSLHVDGVYLARPASFSALTYDVQRIEVLRGPQGTLYGRNATGGAINVITNAPQNEFSASVDVLAGDYDRQRIRGTLNVPIAKDKLTLRVSVVNEERDGFENNVNPDGTDGNDADDFFYRAQLRWDLSEKSSITLRVSDLDRGGVGTARYRMPTPPDSTAPLGNFTPDYDDIRTVFKDYLEKRDLSQTIYSVEGKFDLKHAEATVVLGSSDYELYMTQDGDMTTATHPQPGAQDNFSVRFAAADQVVADLRLNSLADSSFSWLIGVFFLDEDASTDLDVRSLSTAPPFVNFPPFSNPPGTPGQFYRDIDNTSWVETTSKAIYADATFNLSDNVELTTGLRYTEDRQNGVGETNSDVLNFFIGSPPTWRITESATVPADETWTKTTWKLGLNWSVSDDSLLYLTASTGFRSGGFNFGQTDPDLLFYEPENLLAFELGSKNQFADGRVQLNFTAFYYDYQDLQVFQLINDAAYVQNAAEADIYGLETEFVFQVTDNLRFNGHVSLLEATYKDFVSEDQLYPDGPDGVADSGDELVDLSGNNLVQAPEQSGMLGISYTAPFSGGSKLSFRAQIYAQTEIYMRQFNLDPWDKQDSFTKTDVSFRFDSSSEKWHVYGGIDNLEDEDVLADISVTPAGAAFANVRAPRTWYVGIGVDF